MGKENPHLRHYTETQIDRKIDEFHKLGNRLRRYHGRLLLESLKMVKALGMTFGVTDSDLPINLAYDIEVPRKGDEVDTTELTQLARQKFPTLHRKYTQGLARHQQLMSELQEIHNFTLSSSLV